MKECEQFLWISCTNPDHDDSNPSMCVNKVEHNGRPIGYCYCYSCGYYTQIDSKEVKKMSKMKTRARKKRPINWNSLDENYREEWCYISDEDSKKPFNVDLLVLDEYSCGWDGNAGTFPMRNEYSDIIGIHRRFPTGEKCCIEGSQLGLFIPTYLKRVMGICEGVSDACVATECGLPTIGLPSASYGHELAVAYLKRNNIHQVVLIGDKGEPGKESVEKLKKLLDLEPGICYNVLMAENFKDLREFYKVNGKKKTTDLLLGE